MNYKVSMACATEVGAVRKSNQDSVAVFPEHNMAVLADGMGGHLAGEVASRMAIEVVRDSIEKGLSLAQSVINANSKVYMASCDNAAYSGMGTTLVVCRHHGEHVSIASVGDSRFYRQRQRTLSQITRDQTVAQDLREGQTVRSPLFSINRYEHVLTQALGTNETVAPAMLKLEIKPGDLYLLCSDGLTGAIDDELINQVLIAQSGSLETCAQSLIDVAMKYFANDNVSLALMKPDLSE